MSTNRGLFRLSLSEEVNYIIYNIYQKNEKYQIIHVCGMHTFFGSVWQANREDYEERQLEDFSKYVFGMSYQTLKDVMKQQKGREEQCRKQGCWWKREEQLAKKQHRTGSTCR